MAAGTVDSLIYDILVGKDTLSPTLEKVASKTTKFDRVKGSVNQLSQSFSNMTGVLKQAEEAGRLRSLGSPLIGVEKRLMAVGKQAGVTGKQIDAAMRRGSRAAGRFDMRMLSLLFGGMALQRAFGGFLRNVVTTFNKAEDNTSGLAQATTRLSAAWEFFKFSLFDALNTPFFLGIIDGVVGMIDMFSRAPRGVKVAILGITTALAAIGTGALIYAQINLAWGAIFGPGGVLRKTTIETATKIGLVDKALMSIKATALSITFGGFITALGLVAAGVLAVVSALLIMKGLTEQFTEQTDVSINDIALGPVDNLDEVRDGLVATTQEFTNLRGGMDSTISIGNKLNITTGEVISHITTMNDVEQGIIKTGENWLGNQVDLNTQLGNDISIINEYIETLNNIPREIVTEVRIESQDDNTSFLRNTSSATDEGN